MKNTDPVFRSAIATLEKASTGEAMKKALVDFDESADPYAPKPDWEHIYNPDEPPEQSKYMSINGGWTGALATLNASHYMNVHNNTDPEWVEAPHIGPNDKLVDWDPNNPENEYIDQDGNPVKI